MSAPRPLLPHSRLELPKSRICVAVAGSTASELQQRAVAQLVDSDFLELRFDYLPDPLSAVFELKNLLQKRQDASLLATCRPVRSGGQFKYTAANELEVLTAAAQAGVAAVDLSLESAEELGPEALVQLRAEGAAVLLSFHDFQKMGDLEAVLTRMRCFAPDLCKVVPTAQSLADSLALFQTIQRSTEQQEDQLVAIAMGEAGVITRVLGPRFGSAFTFAAASETEATAPGQLTAQALTTLYRIGAINASTRLFGVAGDPIHSSLSPLMHNTAFRHADLDAVYLPLKTSDPGTLLRAACELPLAGFSVTMPLKQTILPFLNVVDPMAARIGAVNTVVRQPDGSLHGFNTDAAGIVTPLEQRLSLQGTRVLVLGSGGAARAAVFGCIDRGARVFLHNRTQATAEALAQEAGATVVDPAQLAREDFDVLIHATPAGMHGHSRALPLEEHELRARLVFDLVYNPLDTPLLALARARGLQVIPGIEMFIQQGVRQFELWTGQPAPAQIMQKTVLDALEKR